MSNEKIGYLIERYYTGVLYYWNGRPRSSSWLNKGDEINLDDGAWTEKPADAIWFLDEGSATGVLCWSLGTVGRVAQHKMVERNSPAPEDEG